ncbi:MAG: CAP domain-containing protein [Deltaproteobacteria bacterium]|nr:CAP domain-containing protein [Deltaproteobacteria bacterium]
MNSYTAFSTALTLGLLMILTGCGSAVLHESWDSETQPTPELPILSSITPCIEFEDSWDPESTEFERQVLELTNQRRAEGADCDTEGVFEPAGPLTLNTKLRCAAKSHSFDMAERNYVAHISPDGTSPATRVQNAGYAYQIVGENIAAGQTTPEQAVAGWMHSDGHCANLMNPSYEEMGAGYAPSDQPPYYHYWTQVFGKPRNF